MAAPLTPRRVVVTGLGLLSPVGNDLESSWDGVLSGRSGAGEITLIDHEGYPVHFACEVKDFDPSQFMDKRECKRVDRFVHFAVAVSKMAMADAGLEPKTLPPECCGVVFGSGIGGTRRAGAGGSEGPGAPSSSVSWRCGGSGG